GADEWVVTRNSASRPKSTLAKRTNLTSGAPAALTSAGGAWGHPEQRRPATTYAGDSKRGVMLPFQPPRRIRGICRDWREDHSHKASKRSRRPEAAGNVSKLPRPEVSQRRRRRTSWATQSG